MDEVHLGQVSIPLVCGRRYQRFLWPDAGQSRRNDPDRQFLEWLSNLLFLWELLSTQIYKSTVSNEVLHKAYWRGTGNMTRR